MPDLLKDYTGKVVHVHYLAAGKEYTKTGIVYDQAIKDGKLDVTMLLTNGTVWQPPYKAEITKVTSVRMEQDLRKALTVLYEAKRQQRSFLESVKTQERMHAEAVSFAIKAVKEASNEMSTRDFADAAESLFCKYFPSTGGFHSKKYFSCCSMSESEVKLEHIQEVEKYANPERFAFLYRRYDGTITFTSEDNGLQNFCEWNAPKAIPSLEPFAKIKLRADVGDKDFLTVSRTYTFTLPFGCTKKSLCYLQDILEGKLKAPVEAAKSSSKKALTEQIKNASSKTQVSSVGGKGKSQGR